MRLSLTIAAFAVLAPAAATAQVAPVVAASEAAPDPASVAVARKLMDQVMPVATREQMMRSMMAGMSQRMIAGINQDSAMSAALGRTPAARAVFDRFIREQIETGTKDMIDNLLGMLDAMAKAYARRFTVSQMNEISAFFATPAGATYLQKAPTIMSDPDVGAWMTSLMARQMARMPARMAALKAELEHLDETKKGDEK